MFKKNRQETLVYIVLWGLLFIAPVLSLYIRTANNSTLSFDWSEVLMVWRKYGIFFALFLVHNHLMAPLLVYRQRKAWYFTVITALVVLFSVYQCATVPDDMRHRGPKHELANGHRPPEFEDHRPPEFEDRRPPEFEDHRPPEFEDHRPPELEDRRPPEVEGRRRPDGMRKPDGKRPAMIFSPHDLTSVIILVLMLGMNLGIKFYFKQRRDQEQLAKLERRNLEQQLEYLKYQLNPHFLMNTLNNIHALVDIDPERSKEAIIQLSKILRYVLYDSNHERVPLSMEREFMDNYTRLMRMRYTDKLHFSVNQPDDTSGIFVPPLLFISFVENAFKHGVSYQKESFISIDCKRVKGKHGEDRLLWTCRNSKHPKPDTTATPRQGGVGMANVRQRLNLIYGDNYNLDINDTDDTYEVILDIPIDETTSGKTAK